MSLDLDALASAAGCHRRTLERWRKAGAPWPAADADLAAWARDYQIWVKAHRKRPPVIEPKKTGEIDQLDRMRAATADLRELELEQRRGDLVARNDVAAEWRRRVFTVRTKLLALPRTIAGRCANSPPEVIEAEAATIVTDLLQEFAAGGDLTPTDP